MDFTFSDEQTMFQESVRRFLADEYGFDKRRAILAEDHGFRPAHWQSFAELGWLAAPFPEALGGLGGSPVETMLLMELFGRNLVVGPYLATVVLGGQTVLLTGDSAQQEAVLPAVAGGEMKLALAFAEPRSRYDLADVSTRATADGAGYVLEGQKAVVFYAATADKIIVTARSAGDRRDPGGITFFLVDADAPGLGARHYRTQDGGSASELTLDRVRVGPEAVLGAPGAALPVLETVLDHGIGAVCAEAGGAIWAVYEQTLDYLKQRKQFGQTIGSFQAIQHRMVDVYMKCQLAQSMVYEVTDALSGDDPGRRRRAAAAAKYEVGRAADHVGKEGIQLHGGMGMMDEMPLGHHFKRITMINASFGDPSHHLRRYAGGLD